MSTSTKSLRTEMLDLAAAQGWTPDPSALTTTSYYSRQWVQDPYVLIKPAAHGGLWRIKLDYRVKASWHVRTGDRLQSIQVWYIAPGTPTTPRTYEGEQDRQGNVIHPDIHVQEYDTKLNPMQFREESYAYDAKLWTPTKGYGGRRGIWVYEATGLDANGETWTTKSGSRERTLRERAEILLTDIDLTIWVAAEIKHQDAVRSAEANNQAKIDKQERAKAPAGVVIDAEAFKELTTKFFYDAKHLAQADGKTTDVADQYAALEAQLAEIKNALGE